MSLKTYIASRDGKVRNLSHRYSSPGQYVIYASGNVVQVKLNTEWEDQSFDVVGAQSQASLYTSIQFGKSLSAVQARCCYKFNNLKNVSFAGNGVKSLGDESFFGCTSLDEFFMQEQMESVGTSAFANCTSLESFTFPKSEVHASDYAFAESGLLSVNAAFKSTVGTRVFSSCSQLEHATMRSSLGVEMFYRCESLADANISARVTSVPQGCFRDCSQLTSVSFSYTSSITEINDNAFMGCAAMSSFQLENTSVTYLGSSVFSGSGVTSLTMPATVSSPTQINSSFLAGSSVTHIKFLGMTSKQMESIYNQFIAYGGDMQDLVFESSDGMKYKVDNNGLVIPDARVYIISIALAEASGQESSKLAGMYNDSEKFVSMVKNAYADKPKLVVGTSRLNDPGVKGSTGLGNATNLNAAFTAAKNAGADVIMFHFSDHGASKSGDIDGGILLYGGVYRYSTLFAQFQKFKYVFAMFCCCYPNSVVTAFKPGDNNTKALFWCAGRSNEVTYETGTDGHDFMARLKKYYKKSYTWSQLWGKIDHPFEYFNKKNKKVDDVQPVKYNYGSFPESDKVFRISSH